MSMILDIIGAAKGHWSSQSPKTVEYKPRHDAIQAAMQRRSDALGGSDILGILMRGKDAAVQAGDDSSARAMDQAIAASRKQQTRPAEGTANEQPYRYEPTPGEDQTKRRDKYV